MALHDYIAEEIAGDCAEGLLTRREALRRLGLLGFSAAAGTSLLAGCGDDEDTSVTTPDAAQDAGPTPTVTDPVAAPTTTPSSASRAPVATTTITTPAPTGAAPSEGEEIRFPGPNGELIGVLAQAADPRGAVLVIHENRGLTEHIRSIPSRLAADGYTALGDRPAQ